ncbi:MAG: type IV toxin-antitoxin system AbiEi family antitoxin domain-containing protein [Microbacteriaceae bacterium]
MKPIESVIRQSGFFLRRRDLLALGYSDKRIRRALANHWIFRVRQGWYSIPDAPAPAIAAVRVGGALTGIAALESYGIVVPRRDRVDLLVPLNACRLRNPRVRFTRLATEHGFDVHWSDTPRGDRRSWRVSVAEALAHVLATEPRHIAIACASAVMHLRRLSRRQLAAIFARAPQRVRAWEPLVSALDESHGETFTRLLLLDAGIPFTQQVRIAGVGRLDFEVAPGVYLEVDGAQHDPEWTGEGESRYIPDNFRDLHMRARDAVVIRIIYPVLYGAWDECVAGIALAIARDVELRARRERHPVPRNLSA